MKYTLQVNQLAVFAIGIQDKVDLIDLCLFDAFKDFANSNRCEKLVDSSGIWFWVSYSMILQEMPPELSGMKSKDAIYRRMKKLESAGLIVFHPNNQILGKTFFQWGENYDAMTSSVPTDKKPEVAYDLRMKNRRGTDEKPEVPTDEKPNNHNTINHTTKQERGAPATFKVEIHEPSKVEVVEVPDIYQAFGQRPNAQTPVQLAEAMKALYTNYPEQFRVDILQGGKAQNYTREKRNEILMQWACNVIKTNKGSDTFRMLNADLQQWFLRQPSFERTQQPAVGQAPKTVEVKINRG